MHSFRMAWKNELISGEAALLSKFESGVPFTIPYYENKLPKAWFGDRFYVLVEYY